MFSGVRVMGIGVLANDPLASPPERVDVAFPLELSAPSTKYMLLIGPALLAQGVSTASSGGIE